MGDSRKTLVVAEVGQAHEGSLGLLHSYIDAVSETGADIIKFQIHLADSESSKLETFRVPMKTGDKTRFDYWKRMEFTFQEWQGVKKHCEEKGLEFLASPFSMKAFQWLQDLGVSRFKIGSGELLNSLMLESMAETGKEMWVSTGMATHSEIDSVVTALKKHKTPVTLFQCTSKYPTPPSEVGLNVLTELKERHHLPVGLSDHSGTIYPSLAAHALGAEVLECHVVFDKKMFGPDASSSLEMHELTQLVEGIRFLDEVTNHPVDKGDCSSFKSMKTLFGKTLSLKENLPKGHVLRRSDLETKKPAGQGIPASDYSKVLGKKLSRELSHIEFLKEEDLGT